MSLPPNSCGRCKHLHISPDAAGRIRPRRGYAHACDVPLPELPALPFSVTRNYGHRWPPERSYALVEWTGCPLFEARKT